MLRSLLTKAKALFTVPQPVLYEDRETLETALKNGVVKRSDLLPVYVVPSGPFKGRMHLITPTGALGRQVALVDRHHVTAAR